MRHPGSKPGLLFQLVIPATAIFIITILSLIAVLFSDERAPLAQWLNRNGNRLLIAELIVVIVLSLLAMTVDRIQTLRSIRDNGTVDGQLADVRESTLDSASPQSTAVTPVTADTATQPSQTSKTTPG